MIEIGAMADMPLFEAFTEPPAVALSLFVACALLNEKAAWRDHRAALAAFFALNAAMDGVDLAATLAADGHTAWLVAVAAPFFFGFGPLIYAYVRLLTDGGRIADLKPLRHAWPAVAAALLMTPFYLLPDAQKTAFIVEAPLPSTTHVAIASVGGLLAMAGFAFHASAYLVASFRRLLRHELRLRDLFSNIEDKTLGWLRTLLLVLSLLWLLMFVGLAAALFPSPAARALSQAVDVAFGVIEPVWIFALGLLALRRRTPAAQSAAPAANAPRSTLPDEDADRILARLDSVMAEQRLFLRPTLTLREVAQAARASEHHLSEALNRRRGVKFYDFVNGLRVEAAAAILRDDADATALDAMIAVGFNARSTFNAAFKKVFGRTPSAYRAARRDG